MGLQLERRYLLLLFVAGLVSRGVVKSTLGTNASLLVLLGVAAYYLYMKRRSESIYDEIARMQAEAAAKIDAIHGLGDGRVTAESLAARKTQFHLDESERLIITDRMHRYSSKMSGSHADRKKFLRRNRRARRDDPETPDANAATVATNALPSSVQSTSSDPSETARRSRPDKIIEEAVDATI